MSRSEKVFRLYQRYYGDWGWGDDAPWHDIEEFICYEGDVCPDCEQGKLLVSKNNKLYCSEICWIEEEPDER